MINEEAKEIKEEIEANAIETTEPTEQVDSPVSEATETSESTQETSIESVRLAPELGEEIVSEPVAEVVESIDDVTPELVEETTPEPVEEITPELVAETSAPVEEVIPEPISEPETEKPEPISEPVETVAPEPVAEVSAPVEMATEPATSEEVVAQTEAVDYSNFSKKDFVSTLEKVMADVKENPSVGAFRRSEDTLKEVRPLFEQIKATEKAEALTKFKEANEDSEEGFDFKFDTDIEQFDKLFKGLKDERSKYFQSIEKEKDKNFNQKTELINRLRTLVEGEDSSDPAHIKTGFNDFKKIQDEWKVCHNVLLCGELTFPAAFHSS